MMGFVTQNLFQLFIKNYEGTIGNRPQRKRMKIYQKNKHLD